MPLAEIVIPIVTSCISSILGWCGGVQYKSYTIKKNESRNAKVVLTKEVDGLNNGNAEHQKVTLTIDLNEAQQHDEQLLKFTKQDHSVHESSNPIFIRKLLDLPNKLMGDMSTISPALRFKGESSASINKQIDMQLESSNFDSAQNNTKAQRHIKLSDNLQCSRSDNDLCIIKEISANEHEQSDDTPHIEKTKRTKKKEDQENEEVSGSFLSSKLTNYLKQIIIDPNHDDPIREEHKSIILLDSPEVIDEADIELNGHIQELVGDNDLPSIIYSDDTFH